MSKSPNRPNSKNESPFKATSIYESWMDGESLKSIESREIATPIAERKQRSNFKFDKRYMDSVSVTPVIHSPIPPLSNPSPSPTVVASPTLQNAVFHTVADLRKSPKKTSKTRSIATSPLIFEDYTEFFDWVFNGNEDDIDPHEIERMLFPSHFKKPVK